jgi:hypothetical protein
MVKVIFYGTEDCQSDKTELTVYVNDKNRIFIGLEDPNWDFPYICLDKATAIKFHRELKKQISFIQEGDENGNG